MDLSSIVPEGAWDSHLHIMDTKWFSETNKTTSTPITAGVWENVIFETSLNCTHVVIVQPTRYGLDNSAALQALAAYGPDRARAVVQFDPHTITSQQLEQWHRLGVRGVRLNFTNNKNPMSATSPDEMPKLLQRYAELIRPFDWAIQLVIHMDSLGSLASVIPNLGVRVVLDHFARPRLLENPVGDIDPYAIEGFETFVKLLEGGNTWVKLSAPYRLTNDNDPEHKSLDPIIKEILRTDSTKAVFGTDWPHTPGFEDLDIQPWVRHLAELTSDNEVVQQRMFRDNARTLWDMR